MSDLYSSLSKCVQECSIPGSYGQLVHCSSQLQLVTEGPGLGEQPQPHPGNLLFLLCVCPPPSQHPSWEHSLRFSLLPTLPQSLSKVLRDGSSLRISWQKENKHHYCQIHLQDVIMPGGLKCRSYGLNNLLAVPYLGLGLEIDKMCSKSTKLISGTAYVLLM